MLKLTTKLGRFLLVRKAYSLLRYQQQSADPAFYQKQVKVRDRSFFEGFDVEPCVKDLHREGVHFGLQLPAPLVEEIYNYAKTAPCTEPGFDGEFQITEVRDGRLRGGRHVLRALVQDLPQCDAIAMLMQDPILLQIVRGYLNYWPGQIVPVLTWSIASDLPEDVRRKGYPPTTFHYDIAGYNFMTAYFYLTDVDASSGAHVMMRNSHEKKPLRMLLASGRHSDSEVLDYYGKENEIVIAGKRGFGFVQDPSCFHKVLSPVTADRLLLQFRYA
jgi:hypothetical protein